MKVTTLKQKPYFSWFASKLPNIGWFGNRKKCPDFLHLRISLSNSDVAKKTRFCRQNLIIPTGQQKFIKNMLLTHKYFTIQWNVMHFLIEQNYNCSATPFKPIITWHQLFVHPFNCHAYVTPFGCTPQLYQWLICKSLYVVYIKSVGD